MLWQLSRFELKSHLSQWLTELYGSKRGRVSGERAEGQGADVGSAYMLHGALQLRANPMDANLRPLNEPRTYTIVGVRMTARRGECVCVWEREWGRQCACACACRLSLSAAVIRFVRFAKASTALVAPKTKSASGKLAQLQSQLHTHIHGNSYSYTHSYNCNYN